ncbi:MAG TPA: type II/IV secretion system protein [Gemmatimonadales bacterium]|jgi:type II secretory ATPase GspE/PulE/Tfp pilus assembly ATPase PilB-like protein/ActR/RegA family two-component response regulator
MPKHWLSKVLVHAEIEGAKQLELDASDSMEVVWAKSRDALGLDDEALATCVAAYYQIPVSDTTVREPRAMKLVEERVARRYGIFPLREDDRFLFVAASDPRDLEAERALAFASGRTPVFEVAPPKTVKELIDANYSPDRAVQSLLRTLRPEDFLDEMHGGAGEGDDGVRVVEETGPEDVAADEADTAPVIRLANLILRDGVEQRASDIHIEPSRAGGVVRFRVDGVLRKYMQMPLPALNRVVSRIKVIADLDISDRLRPQDGRVQIGIGAKNYDLRISTVPTRDSEKVVIRILDPESSVELEQLGLSESELQRLLRLLMNREGIMVVTGPTGSGKTTTLYSCLRRLATGEVNVMTVEDPVEYELAGITQMQVENKRNFTFAIALRAILRQDPDVIFVGEIRDLETAEIAVQAAMTGHLVLATLHTNDALGSIQRLIDLGLDRPSIAESLRGSVAQRLVRKLCDRCAEEINDDLTDEEQRLVAKYDITPKRRAVGCKECGDSGYRGRFPLLEIVTVGSKLRDHVAKGTSHVELLRAAKASGMRPLREMGIDRVKNGLTSLDELERVLGDPVEDIVPEVGRPHVLIVDDDKVDRVLARELLEKNDIDVTEAKNGREALTLIAEEDFSLVVLDLQMPKMKGDAVLEELRKDPTTVGLPVIVLTGEEDPEIEALLIEEGADDYIRKPIDPARFVARVKATLRRATAAV